MNKKIIIIEDDVDLRQIFKTVLEKAGFEIDLVEDGRDVLIYSTLPDLFILDIEMPHVNGLELCKILKARKQTRQIPVLIVSAKFDLEQLASDACADDYLSKPVEVNLLVKKVSDLIGETRSEVNL